MENQDSAQETQSVEEVKPVSIVDQLIALVQKQKSGDLTVLETLKVARLRKQIKNMKRAMNKQRKAMETMYFAPQRRRMNKVMFQVQAVEKALHPKDFDMLKNIFKVVTQPELKDENGVVSQKEQSFVNWQGLIPEARNVIAVQREERIKAGKRKRTTGRSSDRKAHKSTIDTVYNRTEETK